MRTVDEIWDYIMLNDLFYRHCIPDQCWVSSYRKIYIEHWDDDDSVEILLTPIEVFERIDKEIGNILRDVKFPHSSYMELERRCEVVAINNYREYLKTQLSYIEGM